MKSELRSELPITLLIHLNIIPSNIDSFLMLRLACQGVIFTNRELVKYLVEKTHTKTGLSVVATVVDKVYKIGRKVADNFKKNMQITFDEYLPKWNYKAVPQT